MCLYKELFNTLFIKFSQKALMKHFKGNCHFIKFIVVFSYIRKSFKVFKNKLIATKVVCHSRLNSYLIKNMM